MTSETQAPQSSKIEQVAPAQLSAHELHKAMLKIFLCKGSELSAVMTAEEINKLLKEYAYRGINLRYEPTEVPSLP